MTSQGIGIQTGRIYDTAIVAFFALMESRSDIATPENWKGVLSEIEIFMNRQSEYENLYASQGENKVERLSDAIVSYFTKDKTSPLFEIFLNQYITQPAESLKQQILSLLYSEEGVEAVIAEIENHAQLEGKK